MKWYSIFFSRSCNHKSVLCWKFGLKKNSRCQRTLLSWCSCDSMCSWAFFYLFNFLSINECRGPFVGLHSPVIFPRRLVRICSICWNCFSNNFALFCVFILLVYWKHSDIYGFGVGQEDEEYHGLSQGETSHIIVWQVHC